MDEPAITVAVPTCNGARHLREALRSVLAQELPFDLVVVDDRSDDETLVIARDVVGDRARIVINSERLGLAGNWNRCVSLSQTQQVAIFHQDDVMLPGHLALHVAAYRANPNLGWVASGARTIDDQDAPIPPHVVDPGGLGDDDLDFLEADGIAALGTHNPLRCSAVTINAAAHREVGGFDPSYYYVVDWDYWLRVANHRPVAWRAATTVAIRWHPSSETHRFAGGTADLVETSRLYNEIASRWDQGDDKSRWPRGTERRLARAYLSRAHVGFRGGDPALARHALVRSLRLAPAPMLMALVRDPRLLAQMAAAIVAPGWVKRANRRTVAGEMLPDRLE